MRPLVVTEAGSCDCDSGPVRPANRAAASSSLGSCDLALDAPAELRGPLTVLCRTLLIDLPDLFELPDPGGTSGGAEW